MPASILFDMDGVLVDTSSSYLKATLSTARKFLAEKPRRAEAWAKPGVVVLLKASSGFNNDWHLTQAIVLLGLAPSPWGNPERLVTTLDASAKLGDGLEGIRALLGHPVEPLPDTRNMTPLVRAFQSAYLGRDLMARLHPETPFDDDFPDCGAILSERRLVDLALLGKAAELARLGIATGRPREEARFALQHHRLDHFMTVVSHDDVREEEHRHPEAGPLGKPAPWPLEEALRRMEVDTPHCLGYLGDLPDDMRAAVAAGVPGIGIETEATDHALRSAGAMRSFPSTNQALGFLLDPLRA